MFFELEVNICERFPNLSPFEIREKRAYEVFLLVRRLNIYDKNKNKKKSKKIRKPAGDNWF